MTKQAILFSVSVLFGTSVVSPFASSAPLGTVSHRATRYRQVALHNEINGGGARSDTVTRVGEQKDFSTVAANMFGNIRIPAALFAGAAAGAAFAMPLVAGEGLQLGMVKRLYALLMIGSLSSQVIAVTVATVTMSAMSLAKPVKTASVAEYVNQNYNFEWVTARFHFLSGLLLFVFGSGLRAWLTISCPVIAKAALGIIVSGTLLTLAFIDAVERTQLESKLGILVLPVQFFTLLGQRMKKPDGYLFGAAILSSVVTAAYLVFNVKHLLGA